MTPRTKHYFKIGMLPIIMLPVIALTVGITLWLSSSHEDKYALPYQQAHYSKTFTAKDKLAFYEDKDTPESDDDDTAELHSSDKAVFSFTGDTVLVLSDSDPLRNPPDNYRVLYKNMQGNLQVIDLPEAELVKIAADSTEAGKE
jgi:hypothetical protein